MFRIALILFMIAPPIYGDDDKLPSPRSLAARKAKIKHDLIIMNARETYRKTLIEIKKAYLKELNTAFFGAMRATKLGDANAIHALEEMVEKELEVLQSKFSDYARKKHPEDFNMLTEGEWISFKKGGPLFGGDTSSYSINIPPEIKGKVFWKREGGEKQIFVAHNDFIIEIIAIAKGSAHHKKQYRKFINEGWERSSDVFNLRGSDTNILLTRKIKKGEKIDLGDIWCIILKKEK